MKKLKKLFVVFAVLFTSLVILITVATSLAYNAVSIHETIKTKTCWSDGSHCTYTVTHK